VALVPITNVDLGKRKRLDRNDLDVAVVAGLGTRRLEFAVSLEEARAQ
jgi:hypothetical protein